MFAGLLAVPGVANRIDRNPVRMPNAEDMRLVRLQAFLAAKDCPINEFAADFIAAADANDLDWRLLPSISFVESSGGKDFRNNNIFGWDSCNRKFPSVRAGIHIVASRLAKSKLYKDKGIDEILRTYDPIHTYAGLVKSVMDSIGSSELGSVATAN
jgi:hypothetical protein